MKNKEEAKEKIYNALVEYFKNFSSPDDLWEGDKNDVAEFVLRLADLIGTEEEVYRHDLED